MSWIYSIHYMIWLILSCSFFAVGEILSKLIANKTSILLIILAVITSIITTLTWLPAIIQKNQLAVTGTIWAVMSLVITVLIGVFVFNECLCRMKLAGVILAIVAVFLLTK